MYEYIDNGNLEQWLHGDVGPISPLTWDIRMRIAIGTAKGYVILIYYSFHFVYSELGSSALYCSWTDMTSSSHEYGKSMTSRGVLRKLLALLYDCACFLVKEVLCWFNS